MEVPGDGDISEDETEKGAEGDAIADVAVELFRMYLFSPFSAWKRHDVALSPLPNVFVCPCRHQVTNIRVSIHFPFRVCTL